MGINVLSVVQCEALLSLIRAPRSERVKDFALEIQLGRMQHQEFVSEMTNQLNHDLLRGVNRLLDIFESKRGAILRLLELGLHRNGRLNVDSLVSYFELLPYSPDKVTRVALELILVHNVPSVRVCDMLDLAPSNISRLKKRFLSQVESIDKIALSFS